MFLSFHQCFEWQVLKGLSPDQVRQIQCTSIEMALHCQKGEHIDHKFRQAFVDSKLTVGYINGASYNQNALFNKRVRSSFGKLLSQTMPFDGKSLFHLLMFVKKGMEEKLLFIWRRCIAGMCICFCCLPRADGLGRMYQTGLDGERAQTLATLHPLQEHYSEVCGNSKSWTRQGPQSQRNRSVYGDNTVTPVPDSVDSVGQAVLEGTDVMEEHYSTLPQQCSMICAACWKLARSKSSKRKSWKTGWRLPIEMLRRALSLSLFVRCHHLLQKCWS